MYHIIEVRDGDNQCFTYRDTEEELKYLPIKEKRDNYDCFIINGDRIFSVTNYHIDITCITNPVNTEYRLFWVEEFSNDCSETWRDLLHRDFVTLKSLKSFLKNITYEGNNTFVLHEETLSIVKD